MRVTNLPEPKNKFTAYSPFVKMIFDFKKADLTK